MNYQTVKWDIDEKVALITLNRPEQLNAISLQLIQELHELVRRLAENPDVCVAVITGAGRAFMAGADLKEVYQNTPRENIHYNRKIVECFNFIEACPVPFIAAINGSALGGGLELALACTMRIASEEAKLGLPEVKLGILPGAGGTQRLPRLISRGMAMRLLLTGEMVTAEQACQWGLVDQVVPPDKLLETSLALARQVSENAPLAVRAIKESVAVGMELPLEAAIRYTEQHLERLNHSSDSKEGVRAFLERRKPLFTGN